MNKKKYLSIILMIFCALCLSVSQFIFKITPEYNIIYILCGFFILGIGSIAMIIAYRYGELSVLQPINSMSYVFAAFIAINFLNEDITRFNFIGISLIICGVIIIGINNR